MHLGWTHCLLNLGGLGVCAAFAKDDAGARAWAGAVSGLALGVSALLQVASPEVADYAGLSGVLYVLFVWVLAPQAWRGDLPARAARAVFTLSLRPLPHSFPRFDTHPPRLRSIVLIAGVMHGHRRDERLAGAVGRGGGHGARAEPARGAGCAGHRRGRGLVIGLEVLYGFGALIAVVLFAYLVFALICAEEF